MLCLYLQIAGYVSFNTVKWIFKDTSGTNKTWDKAQGNKGTQLNPNNKPGK